MSSKPVLSLSHIRRVFGKKPKVVLSDLSLTINQGEVVALLGPNGAGKTTTVKIASTLLLPTSGMVEVCGIDALSYPRQARAHIGLVLGGDLGFYPRASALDNLRFFADVAGLSSREGRNRAHEVLRIVRLQDSADAPVHTFSRGMHQRLHIARALITNPELLILDEPTNGLDPDIALHIRALIKDLVDQGASVLLTSHLLAEVEDLAHRIDIIQDGAVSIRGTAKDIALRAGLSAVSTATIKPQDHDKISCLLNDIVGRGIGVIEPYQGQWRVHISWSDTSLSADDVCALFKRAGVGSLPDLITRKPTLEESYLALIERRDTCVDD